jgi:FkbM family methyltransferase
MSKTVARLLARCVNAGTAWQSVWRRANTRLRVSNLLLQDHRVDTRRGPLRFRSSHPQALDYPSSFFTREPETLQWIDSFETPCVFWDVGANVGAYTLYAALDRRVQVVAFEPAAANYAALCENIRLNDLDQQVAAYCIALSDRTELSRLNMEHTNPGSVFHSFGTVETSVGGPVHVQFRQGMVGYAADEFRASFGLPAPNYLKIDVDSIEDRILVGAAQTLRDPALRSVLIELETTETARGDRINAALAAAGLVFERFGAGGGHASRNAIFHRAA